MLKQSKWRILSKLRSKYPKSNWNKKTEIDMLSIYEKATGRQGKHTPGGFIAQCPFPNHDDRTPSFVMYTDDQSYHCFGCKQSGSASWFKREMGRIYGL